MRLVLCLLMALSTPAAWAEEPCDDLWFSRNFYFDQAGYCFGSALGQSVFDNSDCRSNSASVPPTIAPLVQELKAAQDELGCRINSGRARPLDVPHLADRFLLDIQPISDGLESACRVETTTPVALRSAPWQGAEIIGYLQPGDEVLLAHYAPHSAGPGWGYASTVWRSGAPARLLGWYADTPGACRVFAG